MRIVRRLLGVAIFVAFLVLGWTFAAEHSSPVSIHFPLAASMEVTLWVALLVAFALGAAITASIAAYRATRQSLVSRRYRKMIRDLESEVHQLRNLPLTGDAPEKSKPRVGDGAAPVPKRALGRGA